MRIALIGYGDLNPREVVSAEGVRALEAAFRHVIPGNYFEGVGAYRHVTDLIDGAFDAVLREKGVDIGVGVIEVNLAFGYLKFGDGALSEDYTDISEFGISEYLVVQEHGHEVEATVEGRIHEGYVGEVFLAVDGDFGAGDLVSPTAVVYLEEHSRGDGIHEVYAVGEYHVLVVAEYAGVLSGVRTVLVVRGIRINLYGIDTARYALIDGKLYGNLLNVVAGADTRRPGVRPARSVAVIVIEFFFAVAYPYEVDSFSERRRIEDIVDVHSVTDADGRGQTEGIEFAFGKVNCIARREIVGGGASVEPYDIGSARKRESRRIDRKFRFAYAGNNDVKFGVVVGLIRHERVSRADVRGYRAERLDLIGGPGGSGKSIVLGGYLVRVERCVFAYALSVEGYYHRAALVEAEHHTRGAARLEGRNFSHGYRLVEIVRHYLLRQYVDVKRDALGISDVVDDVEVHFVQRMRRRFEIEIAERARVYRFDVPSLNCVGHDVAFTVGHGYVIYIGYVDGNVDPLDAGKLCVDVLRLRGIDG